MKSRSYTNTIYYQNLTYTFLPLIIQYNGPGEPTLKPSIKPRNYSYLRARKPSLVLALPLISLLLEQWPEKMLKVRCTYEPLKYRELL